jgi:hypothetical protein
MSKAYRIVLISPPGYTHAFCFRELAVLLKASLEQNGMVCDMAVNQPHPQRVNIVLGYHLLPLSDELRHFTFVPFQLEQLSEREGLFSPKTKQLLNMAEEVWDYSLENIAFLAKQGITARHVPIGYHPILERIEPAAQPDIDVIFFGSLGGRRTQLLNTLTKSQDLTAHALFDVYGDQRDMLIARSKVVLNVHYYSTRIFEAVRVSYLLNNRCCVISEHSSVYPYTGVDIPMVDYNELYDTCVRYARNDTLRNECAQHCYKQFKARYHMADILGRLIAP